MSDSSASKSDTPTPRQQLTTDDDTDHNDDSDDSNDNDDSSSDTDHNDDKYDCKNDDSVFEHGNASDIIEHSIEALSPHKAEAVQVNPNPVMPVLRLNDRPPHLNLTPG